MNIHRPSLARRDKPACISKLYDFSKSRSLEDWIYTSGTHEINDNGVQMKLMKPEGVKREYMVEDKEKLPINSVASEGFTFNHTGTMLYGKFSTVVKSAPAPGAITAVILYAENGDEIDFEFLAGKKDQVTSNYFYGPNIVYGVNGQTTDCAEGNAYDDFHRYTIEWTKDKIVWSIDNKVVRTTYKNKTELDPKHGNVHQYPTHPAHISIGLWDGSSVGGTAQWAQGPIDWEKYPHGTSAYIKSVEIECSTE
ncbi:putative glycosidase crf1 [Choanephora cucurbitarum]|uniref:Putative glycosidase crf1 n=1 Tax=Choanephora cucurbitarum TaxID=101091 RepID=A0A1C7NIM8_9FUNG|nr:putative glycosidase crf1 [Choanephora cucurbitarum]